MAKIDSANGVMGKSEKTFQVIIYLILGVMTLLALLPFILLLSSSFSDNNTLMREGYSFIPRNFTLYAYEYIFKTNAAQVLRSYAITFLVTILGTAISLFIGPMLAWPLARSDYKRGKIITFIVFFTLLFNGGLVPSYIMWTQLFHIKNTIWALVFSKSYD